MKATAMIQRLDRRPEPMFGWYCHSGATTAGAALSFPRCPLFPTLCVLLAINILYNDIFNIDINHMRISKII